MRRGYDQDVRGSAVRADRVADGRLPAVRDRPLHRRPRLVRRRVGEQLPLRSAGLCSIRWAASTRASRRRAGATRTSTSSSGCGHPGVTLVTILGEGSFHQVHGGTTTNETQPVELIRSYEEQYEKLRGRRFRLPDSRCTTWARSLRRRVGSSRAACTPSRTFGTPTAAREASGRRGRCLCPRT